MILNKNPEKFRNMDDKIKKPLRDDRRTQKTKKLLVEALRELVIEKGYDAITIQDIIDRANVGRSTFYSHYESKEELFVGNINFQGALVDVPINDHERYPMGINLSYLFSEEHLAVSKAMFGTKSIDILFNYFTELCAAKILEYCRLHPSNYKNDQKMLRYSAQAAAGGLMRMLFKWFEDGAVVPADEMIVYARKFLEKDFL